MKVYLVRHGESEANVSKMHQTADEPLTTLGKTQATQVADRFKTISIQKIISSPFVRAFDTATEIKKVTGLEIETSELFTEVKRPSELKGVFRESNESKDVFNKIIENESDPAWHYSDEENFYDLKNRVKRAIEFLENQKQEEIAVVTHSVFIRMLIGFLAFGERMNPDMLRDLGDHFKINNTGITLLEFEHDIWKILTWNDYAHLG